MSLCCSTTQGKRESVHQGELLSPYPSTSILTGKFKKPTTTSAADFVKAYYDEVPEHTFGDNVTTNAVGPYWLTFAFLPLLEKWKEHAGGSRPFAPQIIMTSSMNGWSKVREPDYNMSYR